MIIVKIYGGLGNQMFQYAAARRLAMKHQVQLKLFPGFSGDNLREYRLKFFNIDDPIADQKDVDRLILHFRTYKGLNHKILRWVDRLKPYYKRRYYKYKPWSGDTGILKASPNVFLDGYWANELFFKDIRNELHDRFEIKDAFVTPSYKGFSKMIRNSYAVSVHIRRGDYAANEHTRNFFGVLPREYYQRAVDYVLNKYPGAQFFVFSDDPEYVKRNLHFNPEVVFVEGKNLSDFHELKLMSYCRHNIIANSTFSWWAAWLNKNPEKTVIAPATWYKNKEAQRFYEQYPFVPDTWIKL